MIPVPPLKVWIIREILTTDRPIEARSRAEAMEIASYIRSPTKTSIVSKTRTARPCTQHYNPKGV